MKESPVSTQPFSIKITPETLLQQEQHFLDLEQQDPQSPYYRGHSDPGAAPPRRRFMLYVHGMVKQAKKFSMADIKRYPALSRIMFLECSGNGLTEWAKPTLKTVQGTHGLTSTSEWT